MISELCDKQPRDFVGGRHEWRKRILAEGGEKLKRHAADLLDFAIDAGVATWHRSREVASRPGLRRSHSVKISHQNEDGQLVFDEAWMDIDLIKKNEGLSMQVVDTAIDTSYAYQKKANQLVEYINEGNRAFQLELPFKDLPDEGEGAA